MYSKKKRNSERDIAKCGTHVVRHLYSISRKDRDTRRLRLMEFQKRKIEVSVQLEC